MDRPLALLLPLLLAACAPAQVRDHEADDAELIAAGEWTARDAEARRLLDVEAPPHLKGRYPVRLPPARRKVITEVHAGGVVIPLPRIGLGWPFQLGFLEALLGLDYERRYQFVARERTYVIVNRDRPATIVREDGEPAAPPPTDPAVFRGLRRDLARELDAVERAAERTPPVASP